MGVVLLAVGVAYAFALRPALAHVEHLAIIEYPIAFVLGLVALRLARAGPVKERVTPLAPGRRHVQVVRDLSDPEVQRVEAALAPWIDRGEGRDIAARLLARAMGARGRDDAALAARIEEALPDKATRAKRENAIRTLIRPSKSTGV